MITAQVTGHRLLMDREGYLELGLPCEDLCSLLDAVSCHTAATVSLLKRGAKVRGLETRTQSQVTGVCRIWVSYWFARAALTWHHRL